MQKSDSFPGGLWQEVLYVNAWRGQAFWRQKETLGLYTVLEFGNFSWLVKKVPYCEIIADQLNKVLKHCFLCLSPFQVHFTDPANHKTIMNRVRRTNESDTKT